MRKRAQAGQISELPQGQRGQGVSPIGTLSAVLTGRLVQALLTI